MVEVMQTIIFDANVIYVTLLIPEDKYQQYLIERQQTWNITTRLYHAIFETKM